MDGKAGLAFGQDFADIDLVAPVEVDPPLVLAGRIHSIIVFRQFVDLHFQVVFLDVNIACGPVRVIRDQDDLHRLDLDRIVDKG